MPRREVPRWTLAQRAACGPCSASESPVRPGWRASCLTVFNAMGFLYRETCYPDAPTAKAALCSQAYALTPGTTAPAVAFCSSTTFTGSTYTLVRQEGSTQTTHTIAYPAFPTCEASGVSFFMEFWPIALSLAVAVVCAKVVLNIFRGRHEVI